MKKRIGNAPGRLSRLLCFRLPFLFITLLSMAWGACRVTATSAPGDWGMFRHDQSHSGRSPFTGPATPAEQWAFATYGAITLSSPVLAADGTVYLGANDGNLYAVLADGTEKWAFQTMDAIYSSPAIGQDGTIYVGSQDGNFYAINPDGSLQWALATGSAVASSPAISADGTIYIGSLDGNLYAVNVDGTLRWAFTTGDGIWSSPALGADGTIYVGSRDGNLYALNANGTEQWAFNCFWISSSPVLGTDGTIYIAADNFQLYALDPTDGTQEWAFTAMGYLDATPALGADGTIYLPAEDDNLYAIDPATGQQNWIFSTGGALYSSPAVGADGTIYLGSADDHLYAITATGTQLWSLTTGDQVWSSPALGADGTLYTGSMDGNLYAIGAAIPATQLQFGTQPANTAIGKYLSPPVTVWCTDAYGKIVTSATTPVTLKMATNPNGATLGGTLTVTPINGVATFNNLSVSKTGTGDTLQASAAGFAVITSQSFTVFGPPVKLIVLAQPANTAVNTIMAPITVAITDTSGNIVCNAAGNITLALGSNTAGAALKGTLTQPAVNGVATFSNLQLTKDGIGFTLRASAPATRLVAVTSHPFNIIGPASRLVMQSQPSNTVAGANITPAVTVLIEDSAGNLVTTATTAVTLALGTNPGGATLGGTLTEPAVNGVATFSTLTLLKAGAGYTLKTTNSGLTNAVSRPFTITHGPATTLAFHIQPANTQAGATIAPAITVLVQDAYGNTVTGATNSITIALGVNPSGASLAGTQTVKAINGSATFNNLSLKESGTGYTLSASSAVGSPSLTGASSRPFNITPALPAVLHIQTQPSNTIIGAPITPALTVLVTDRFGNATTAATTIMLALAANPSGATLGGTLKANAVNGVATFSNVTLNKAGNGYILRAVATGLASALSQAFDISAG